MDRTVIARKQYSQMTDLMAEFVSNPTPATDRALTNYQDSVGWPWKATQEQLNDWNSRWSALESYLMERSA